MALFSPFLPFYRGDQTVFDNFDDHPFLNFNSSFFRDANLARANRANVSETEAEYKVEIEVPGYQKPEIAIEFGSDGRSLTISGKTEKTFEEESGRATTVEDVPEEGEKAQAPASTSTAVAETSGSKQVGRPAPPKYWVSERSVGSFTRTFSFRSALDTEKAKASLEHGVLTIVIPKATKHAIRKINIA